jgi:hypothetical protein
LFGEQLRVTDAGTLELVGANGRLVWTSGPTPVRPSYSSQVRAQEPDGHDFRLAIKLGTERTPLVRTDFTDDEAWGDVIRRIAETPSMAGSGAVDRVEDRDFDGVAADRLLGPLRSGGERVLAFVADAETFSSPERHLLMIYLGDDEPESGRLLRVVPEAVSTIDLDLSLGNNDWEDYADNADTDGVLRETYQ